MLHVVGGSVYDPANGVNGEVRDIYAAGGKICDGKRAPGADGDGSAGERAEVIDARGMVVMAGGVDLHSHIAGPKVNVGRTLSPGDHRMDPVPRFGSMRGGVGHVVPSTFVMGRRYAEMGYTTVMEAAAPPMEARHVHEELDDIPMLDTGMLLLMGNNHFVLSLIDEGDRERLADYIVFLLGSTGGYGIKAVNPGGGVNWRRRGNLGGLDDAIDGYDITPRHIIDALIDVNERLRLPHPVHLHCNNLGQPTSAETTLQTMQLADGRPLHITHLQFNAYGPKKGAPFASGVQPLADYVNSHPNISVDVGQVVFGPAVTMTGDAPFQHSLLKLTKDRWTNKEIEMETQSGVVPLAYSKNTYVGATQWLVGMEIFLLMEDPWRIYLTTDSPNGGPFTAYPWVIRLLMDRAYREETAKTLNKRALEASCLLELEREYTLEEIAIITRAGPAARLGLRHKGHLGVGADADIAVYEPCSDYEAMFARPRYVIKSGRVVVRDGRAVQECFGRRFLPDLPDRDDVTYWLAPEFARLYSVSFSNYPIDRERFEPCEVVPCR